MYVHILCLVIHIYTMISSKHVRKYMHLHFYLSSLQNDTIFVFSGGINITVLGRFL